MMTFLEEAARRHLELYGDDLQNTAVVFPNKRMAVNYLSTLGRISGKTMIAPADFTITELLETGSPWKKAEHLELLYILYTDYCRIMDTQEEFSSFIPWGEMLLNDFDEVDKYHADARILYANLLAEKELMSGVDWLSEAQIKVIMQFWSTFEEDTSGTGRQTFMRIWERLYDVYISFRNTLSEQGVAYEGMIHRTVTESLNSGIEKYPYVRYLIIGFNQLNPCEKRLFTYLQKNGKADFYYDCDLYYLENQTCEAGLFLRENLKLFPPRNLKPVNLLRDISLREIEVVSVSSYTAQARVAAARMEPNEVTALILPDDYLLLPILNAVPAADNRMNITMGMSLRHSPVFSLTEALHRLRKNIRKEPLCFYFQPVIDILRHPYVRFADVEENQRVIDGFSKSNTTYPLAEQLIYNTITSEIFSNPDQLNLIEYSIKVFESVLLSVSDDSAAERNTLKNWLQSLYHTARILRKQGNPGDDETNFRILKQLLSSTRLSFVGDPAAGSQILGPLETRSLDFPTVIIPSMNEGVFPNDSVGSSYIPYALRKAFEMPAYEEKSATQAYFFYRSLQRAKRVVLIYNTETDGLNGGEPSRYLRQLDWELNYPIKYTHYTNSIQVPAHQPISIPKTAGLIERMKAFLEPVDGKRRRISPNAFNSYLDCRLKFYFSYLAGMKESEEVTDEIDSAIFGTFLHNTMEHLLKSRLGRVLNESDLEEMKREAGDVVDAEFRKKFGNSFIIDGPNRIIRKSILDYVRLIIDYDKRRLPFTVLGVEIPAEGDTLQWEVPLHGTESASVLLSGRIDRLDEKEGVLQIIDYKTGKDVKKISSIEELFEREGDKRNKAALQTLIYAMMIVEKTSASQPVETLLFNLREMTGDDFTPGFKIDDGAIGDIRQYGDELKQYTSEVLDDLFSPDVPFNQTAIVETCRYCPYAGICRRD